MSQVGLFVIYASAAVWCFCMMMLVRNEWVAKHRQQILNQDSERTLKLIDKGEWLDGDMDYFKRFNSLPSYGKMMWKFWVWDIRKFL